MRLVCVYTRRAVLQGLAGIAAALLTVFATGHAAAHDVPLAIKGYDPVAYFTIGKPTRGRAEFDSGARPTRIQTPLVPALASRS